MLIPINTVAGGRFILVGYIVVSYGNNECRGTSDQRICPPMEEGEIAPYVTNHGQVESVDRMLVEVETDEGITG